MSENDRSQGRKRVCRETSRADAVVPDNPTGDEGGVPTQTGGFGTKLSTILNNSPGSLETLFGRVPTEGTPTFETLKVISNFLTQNDLAQVASIPSNTGEWHSAMASYYAPSLEEFSQTQLDRQAAGLRSNTNRASSEDLTKLVDAHRHGLCVALDSPKLAHLLSNDFLKTIHELSLPPSSGDSTLRGNFRTKRVRAGNISFGPHERIADEMHLVWKHMLQLDKDIRQTSSGVAKVYYSIALAVMALYAICDVHPFVDGNGRVSRIYCNAILKCTSNLPFTTTIAATPQERQELVSGLRAADQAIVNIEANTPNPNEGAILQPLIEMLIARLTHAMLQLHARLEEKARSSKDEEETKIARKVRERAAEGQCIICLENNPNIATLCCGQAVHLNCIAEWLANGTTCVGCRASLPRLSVQRQRTAQGEEHHVLEERPDDVLQNPASTMHRAIERAIRRWIEFDLVDGIRPGVLAPNEFDGAGGIGHGTSEDDGESSDTSSVAHDANQHEEDVSSTTYAWDCRSCTNRAAQDCDHHLCGRCCVAQGHSSTCQRHGTRSSDQNSTTNEDVQAPSTASSTADDIYESNGETSSARAGRNTDAHYCRYCTNRAAQDCDHRLCGRCCVVQGLSFSCQRHGG